MYLVIQDAEVRFFSTEHEALKHAAAAASEGDVRVALQLHFLAQREYLDASGPPENGVFPGFDYPASFGFS